ncbi:hypothetical protein FJT64_005401 [Amphibalanus amphitrite]|uniref:Reelin domain-containing protein n=1 Tax=Amphibalanus amphitrite TaxID=1232801 RepID=A0A6A4W061_AMPAM|nr:hypothetical protein FJT64_007303 [Amphibalanus amphitrite]KAF0297150.1 hypothetical protein FJT64_005401 [Amphibalanus amphitrite]
MMKLLVTALALCLGLVAGFSNNEFVNPAHKNFACQNLYPKHEPFEPQTGANPYSLTVTDAPGGKQVTISGDSFKGFILQASSGSFSSPSHPIINVGCPQGATIRQKGAGVKNSFSVLWVGSGPVSFK